MKKFLASLFLVFISFNLFAQDAVPGAGHTASQRSMAHGYREAKIFVLPISGIGTPEANAYFYKQLVYEATAQLCAVVKMSGNSDYTLKGRIEPFACVHDSNVVCPYHSMLEREASVKDNPEYVFYLELLDSATDEMIGWQYIVFSRIDIAVNNMISVMVYNLLSSIPDIALENDRRYSWFFIGAGVMWAPRMYTNVIDSIYWMNVGAGLDIEIQFMKFLSVGVGLQFSQDWILISETAGEEYRDLILEVPVSLRFVFKPADYLLEPYGGYSYNISMMNVTIPSMSSWFAGIQLGIRAGPGFLTVDTRFSMDFYDSSLSPSSGTQLEYRRYMLQVGVGYKFGLFSKYKSKD